MAYIRNVFADFGGLLRKVRGNASEILFTQVVWSIAFVVYTPFLTQYMLRLGMSTQQVGVVSAAATAAGMAASVFAGWITDRLGRRETYTLFDLISWSSACALWAISNNFAWFLFAGIVNALTRIGGVAHTCLLTEDVAPEDRMAVFSAMSIASVVAGFFSPLANLLINPYGLVTAMRAIYAGSAVIYTIIFIRRYLRLTETPIARQMKAEAKRAPPLRALKDYPALVRHIWGNKLLLVLILLRAVFFMQMTLRSTYISIALIQGLGFDDTVLSQINLVGAAVTLIVQITVIPKLAGAEQQKPLLAGLCACLAGYAVLLACPAGNMPVMLASIVISSVGGVLCNMLIETLFANTADDKRRATLIGFMTFVTMAIQIPFTLLCGYAAALPVYGPMLPMAIGALLYLCCIVLLALYMRAAPKARHPRHG